MTRDFNITKLNPALVVPLHKFFGENGQLVSEHFYPHPFTLDYLIYLMVTKPRDFYCVLSMEDKVVGYGILRGWDEGYEIPSLGIAIHKDYRGLGLSKVLMIYLHTIASLRGAKKVRLKVHKENKAARALYEKFSYVFREFNDQYDEGIKDL